MYPTYVSRDQYIKICIRPEPGIILGWRGDENNLLKTKVRIMYLFLKGSDWTMSLDGHDKLCGYQNATFPLCVYGGLDTYSGRIQFLKIWTTNSNPKIVGRHYLEYLLES